MARRLLSVFLAGLLLGGALPALAEEKVLFSLGWIPIARDSGFYTALDRGLFRDRGLSVTIQAGSGSGEVLKRVLTRSADFGFIDTGILIVARSKGGEAKMLGMFHSKSLMGVFFLKGSGIQRPKDLEGRTIGDAVGSAPRVIFPAFAAANGVDLSKVTWVNMTPPAKVPSLVAQKVHSVTTMATDLPTIRASARKAGVEVEFFLYADYGLDIYTLGLASRDEMIQSKPDLVRNFIHATYGGIAWAVEHREEAVKTFLKYNPTADPQLTRAEWEIAVEHLLTKEALKNGIGHMDRERMEFTRAMIGKYMELGRPVSLEEVYTNDFLPRLFPKRP